MSIRTRKAPDDGAHAVAADDVDGNAAFFDRAQHAEVRETTRTASAEYESHRASGQPSSDALGVGGHAVANVMMGDRPDAWRPISRREMAAWRVVDEHELDVRVPRTARYR